MKMNHKVITSDIKAEGDGSTFSGYCSVFHNCDASQEIVSQSAFADTLASFRSTGFLCCNHVWDSPVGKPVSATVDKTGLFITGRISDTASGRDLKVLLKDGVISRMSIGYRVLSDSMLNTAAAVADYWKSAGYTPSALDLQRAKQSPVRLLTGIALYEASLVSLPANELATVTGVKQPLSESQRLYMQFMQGQARRIDAVNTERLDKIKREEALRRPALIAANRERIAVLTEARDAAADRLEEVEYRALQLWRHRHGSA